SNYQSTVADVEQSLQKQKTQLKPGDVVLIRTGTLRYWGETGSDHAKIAAHDSAGISVETAKWLVEQNGAIMICSDTSGVEYQPKPEDAKTFREKNRSFMPLHNYLLIEQGIHIGRVSYPQNPGARQGLRILLHRLHQQDQRNRGGFHDAADSDSIKYGGAPGAGETNSQCEARVI